MANRVVGARSMLMRRIASLSFATSLGRARGLGRNAHKSCVRRFAAGKQGGAFPPGPEQWDSWTEIGFGVWAPTALCATFWNSGT